MLSKEIFKQMIEIYDKSEELITYIQSMDEDSVYYYFSIFDPLLSKISISSEEMIKEYLPMLKEQKKISKIALLELEKKVTDILSTSLSIQEKNRNITITEKSQ